MMQPKHSKHWLRFTIGIGLALLLILLQGTVFRHSQLPFYLLILVALIVLIPLVWGFFGWLNALRTFDELQRRVLGEAGLFSLGMISLSTFGYGFLEVSAGFPRLSMFWLLPLVAVTYFIGVARAQWRYR